MARKFETSTVRQARRAREARTAVAKEVGSYVLALCIGFPTACVIGVYVGQYAYVLMTGGM